ncbi:MAG: YkgJ family cysteine cluster protein [Armatimonadetes bacterium]|nr:YkgJ family cysteine cluster protein [Armatimonadota bacterium]
MGGVATDTGVAEGHATAVTAMLDLADCGGCHACGLRCTEGIAMSRWEFEAVRALASRETGRARETVDLGEGVVVRMCRFWRTRGGCAVYEARPLVCRMMGAVEWMPCPLGKAPRPAPASAVLPHWLAYADTGLMTYEEWEATCAGHSEDRGGAIP